MSNATTALSAAASGMTAQQFKVANIAHNLANQTTPGFQRKEVEFKEMYSQPLRTAGTDNPASIGKNVGLGVKIGGTYTVTEQGPIKETKGIYDIALQGRGYLQVIQTNGEVGFTRAGNLMRANDGTLKTQTGLTIAPGIVIPIDATNINISETGVVSGNIAGSTDSTQFGQIELADFPNASGLQPIGNNLLLATPASGAAVVGLPGTTGMASILQGSIESSNVNAILEMTDMIACVRAYDQNSTVIKRTDEMMRETKGG